MQDDILMINKKDLNKGKGETITWLGNGDLKLAGYYLSYDLYHVRVIIGQLALHL